MPSTVHESNTYGKECVLCTCSIAGVHLVQCELAQQLSLVLPSRKQLLYQRHLHRG